MAWMPFWAAGIINGVGHFWGYRNFDCPDASTNVSPWGILIGGEELHNNHHAYPSSAKLSIHPWEFDIGWFYIRLFQRLGLAQPKRVAPTVHPLTGKHQIDIDALKALLANQFQVMARYTNLVLLPVLKAEVTVAKQKGAVQAVKVLRSLKKAVTREGLIDNEARQQVRSSIAHHQALDQVYQFRLRLQTIWDHRTATQKELLDALQQWCAEAEQTGSKALREFSEYMKGYSIA
jgi:stearoyl-CoA desaturase (delta-9 desaturase)